MNLINKYIRMIAIPVAALFVLYLAVHWVFERAYVGPDEALMVINKFGDPLPADRVVSDDDQHKGVQAELRGPGRYFLNPITHDWKVIPQVQISAGNPAKWEFDSDGHIKDLNTAPEIGLLVLKEGKSPPPGMDVVEAGYKGIQREVLTPGTYKINSQRYEFKREHATIVPPGSVGVVTR